MRSSPGIKEGEAGWGNIPSLGFFIDFYPVCRQNEQRDSTEKAISSQDMGFTYHKFHGAYLSSTSAYTYLLNRRKQLPEQRNWLHPCWEREACYSQRSTHHENIPLYFQCFFTLYVSQSFYRKIYTATQGKTVYCLDPTLNYKYNMQLDPLPSTFLVIFPLKVLYSSSNNFLLEMLMNKT